MDTNNQIAKVIVLRDAISSTRVDTKQSLEEEHCEEVDCWYAKGKDTGKVEAQLSHLKDLAKLLIDTIDDVKLGL